jgi:hypothetical protein
MLLAELAPRGTLDLSFLRVMPACGTVLMLALSPWMSGLAEHLDDRGIAGQTLECRRGRHRLPCLQGPLDCWGTGGDRRPSRLIGSSASINLTLHVHRWFFLLVQESRPRRS